MPIYTDQPATPIDAGVSDYLARQGVFAGGNFGTYDQGLDAEGNLDDPGAGVVGFTTVPGGRRIPIYGTSNARGGGGYGVPGDGGFSAGVGSGVARALPPTRASLWNTAYGATPLGYDYRYGRRVPTQDVPAWQRDPHSNPSLAPATEDDRMLAENDMAHQLAQQVYMRGTADQSQRRVQMLQNLLQSGASPNLYGAPRNAQDADLQNFIQQDLNAGYRGWALIPTQEQLRKRLLENLRIAQERQQLGLDQAKFISGNRRNAQNDRFNQALDLAKLRQTTNYENAGLRARQAALDQANSEHNETMAQHQSDKANMLDRYDARTRATADRENQREALKAVENGMDPDEASAVYGIQGTGRDVLNAWGGQTDVLANTLNANELAKRRELSGTPAIKHWFRPNDPAIPSSDDRFNLQPLSPADYQTMTIEGAKSGLTYDPLLGFYRPNRQLPDVWAGTGLDDASLGYGNRGQRISRRAPAPDGMGGATPVRAEDGSLLVSNQAQLNSLPSGTVYRDAWSGKLYRKR